MPGETRYISLPAQAVTWQNGSPVITDGPTTLDHPFGVDANRYVKIAPGDSFGATFGLAELPDGGTLADLADWSVYLESAAMMTGTLPPDDQRVLGVEYVRDLYEGAYQLAPGTEAADGYQHWPLVTGFTSGWGGPGQAILNNFTLGYPTTVAKPLGDTTFGGGPSYLWGPVTTGGYSASTGLSPLFSIVYYPSSGLPADLAIYLYSLQITIRYRLKVGGDDPWLRALQRSDGLDLGGPPRAVQRATSADSLRAGTAAT